MREAKTVNEIIIEVNERIERREKLEKRNESPKD